MLPCLSAPTSRLAWFRHRAHLSSQFLFLSPAKCCRGVYTILRSSGRCAHFVFPRRSRNPKPWRGPGRRSNLESETRSLRRCSAMPRFFLFFFCHLVTSITISRGRPYWSRALRTRVPRVGGWVLGSRRVGVYVPSFASLYCI